LTAAGGYEGEREEALKFFTKDQIVKVKKIEIGGFSSRIEFEERPGKWFNSVLFEPIGDDVLPEEVEPELLTLRVTEQQRDMMLAALRLWIDVVNDGGGDYINADLLEIATHVGQNALMDDNEIDALCQEINIG